MRAAEQHAAAVRAAAAVRLAAAGGPGLPRADTFTAHSLRAGGATSAYRAGTPVSAIARHGRWADNSPVVLGYIRSVDRWKTTRFGRHHRVGMAASGGLGDVHGEIAHALDVARGVQSRSPWPPC